MSNVMSEAIITVENLSKRYKLGTIGATTFKESVERGWHRLRGRDWRAEMGTIGHAAGKGETLDSRPWTLDQGGGAAPPESLKSKVYSPKSSPNSLKSKVQSPKSSFNAQSSSPSDELWALKDVSFEVKRGEVLGVGPGFHPELTGRENVYLNGAILGLFPA